MIKFIDNPEIHNWDNTEVHPILILPDGCHETCEPNEATYWTVLIHFDGGGTEGIADFDTEGEANDFKYLIDILVARHVK